MKLLVSIHVTSQRLAEHDGKYDVQGDHDNLQRRVSQLSLSDSESTDKSNAATKIALRNISDPKQGCG